VIFNKRIIRAARIANCIFKKKVSITAKLNRPCNLGSIDIAITSRWLSQRRLCSLHWSSALWDSL